MNDKLKAYHQSLTHDDRVALLVSARLAKEAKSAVREANKLILKMDYLDSSHWQSLATLYKIRMPMEGEAASINIIRKYLNRANVSSETFNEHYTSAKYFVTNNPLWTAYATAGIILELKEQEELL